MEPAIEGKTFGSSPSVDFRVPVPRSLQPHSVDAAKKQRKHFRVLLLGTSGAVLCFLSIALAFLITPTSPADEWILVPLTICGIRILLFGRSYGGDVPRRPGLDGEALTGLRLASLGSVAGTLVAFAIESGLSAQVPRDWMAIEWALSTAIWVGSLAGLKLATARRRNKGWNTRRVMVVGRGTPASRFVEYVESHPESGYRIAGIVPYQFAAGASKNDLVPGELSFRPLAAGSSNASTTLPELIDVLDVDDTVFTHPVPRHQAIRLLSSGPQALSIYQLTPWADGPSVRTRLSIAGFPVLDPLSPYTQSPPEVIKRFIDIGLSVLALALWFPVILISALLIRVTSPGPAIFRQVRVGQHGRRFVMYKLRTMEADTDPAAHEDYVERLMRGTAELEDGRHKMSSTRVTRLGRWLRRLSIDELPQFWNVLNGTMSLVGPRPPTPYEIPLHDSQQIRRLDTKPGVTGIWQISARNDVGYKEMVSMDLEYIEHWSLGLDLQILLKTPMAVLRDRATA